MKYQLAVKKMTEKVNHDYEEHVPILGGITLDYLENIDKSGIKDVYLKIGQDMIDKEVNLFM